MGGGDFPTGNQGKEMAYGRIGGKGGLSLRESGGGSLWGPKEIKDGHQGSRIWVSSGGVKPLHQ